MIDHRNGIEICQFYAAYANRNTIWRDHDIYSWRTEIGFLRLQCDTGEFVCDIYDRCIQVLLTFIGELENISRSWFFG